MYSCYKLFELKFSGKTSEEKYAASHGTKAIQIFFLKYLRLLSRMYQKHRDSTSHIERTVNVLGKDPTKITITNASIDKQITLKKPHTWTRTQDLLVVNSVPKPLD